MHEHRNNETEHDKHLVGQGIQRMKAMIHDHRILNRDHPACEDPTDSDECLKQSWTTNWTCRNAIEHDQNLCESWARDMRRCCPDACGNGYLTESDCKAIDSKGTCTYPNCGECYFNSAAPMVFWANCDSDDEFDRDEYYDEDENRKMTF